MNEIRVTIPGPLRGKERPRFGAGRVHTSRKTVSAERGIAWHVVQQVGQRCLQGALAVRLEVGIAVPRSWAKARRAEALQGALRPVCKPDLDNVAKLVLDALNGVLWADDAQVAELTVTRHYVETAQSTLTVRAA